MKEVKYCLTKRKTVDKWRRDVYIMVEDGAHFFTLSAFLAMTFNSKKEAEDYKKEHKLRGYKPELI